MNVETVPIASLVLDPANVRRHPEANVDAIKASLVRFGQQKPIVVGKDNVVVAGNGTLVVARDLGWTEISIVRTTLTGAEAIAYAIADNRTAELADWDEEGLARVLEALQRDGLLEAAGFTYEALGALRGDVGADPVDDPGPEDPPEHPVTQLGDLWVLGDHRLLCGDSTSAADVDRVMAGEKAALIATDPPYLVNYTGERPNGTGKDWTDKYREIDIEDSDVFFRAVFANIKRVAAPHAAIYCWHAHKRCGEIQKIWRDLGILDHQQIVWVKPLPVFGRVFWHFRHEPCMMGWVQGSKPQHDGEHADDSVWTDARGKRLEELTKAELVDLLKGASDVWDLDWDGKSRAIGSEHPTEKPVEIFARPMRKHTKTDDVVFEPFSGSGSQIIAAAKEGRRCHAIEITPAFVDVAVKRWQGATKRDAILEATGATFAAVAAQREAATLQASAVSPSEAPRSPRRGRERRKQ